MRSGREGLLYLSSTVEVPHALRVPYCRRPGDRTPGKHDEGIRADGVPPKAKTNTTKVEHGNESSRHRVIFVVSL